MKKRILLIWNVHYPFPKRSNKPLEKETIANFQWIFPFLICLLCMGTAWTQTGPAGINSGIRLWLDAGDMNNDGGATNPANGANVTSWTETSGTAANFTVRLGKTPPTYVADGGPLFNNQPAVDFDNGDVLEFDVADWDGDHTMFIVFSQQTIAPGLSGFFASGIPGAFTTSDIDDLFQISVDALGVNFSQRRSQGVEVETTFEAQDAGSIKLYAFTNSNGTVETFVDGLATGNTTTTINPDDGSFFDAYLLNSNRGGSVHNNALLAEVIIYDRVLSASEFSRVNNYLNCKYGASFATTSPGGIDACDVSLWLKADSGVTGGASVTEWEDQSVSGANATQGNVGQQPTLETNSLNFNPTVVFNTTNDDKLTNGTLPGTTREHMFGVYFANIADADGYNASINPGVKCQQGLASAYNGSNVGAKGALNISIGENKAVQSGIFNTYQNGALLNLATSGANAPGTGYTLWSELGGTTPGVELRYAEHILFGDTLGPLEAQKVNSYLALKYGITLDAGITSYLASDGTTQWWNDATYWNEVAGIAQDDGSALDQRVSKSINAAGIITMATTADFASANNDVGRTSLGDGNALVWGNNGTAASTAWTTTGAPTNFAILGEVWSVKETGTVGTVNLQVDVDDAQNDVPTFVGDLYIVRGSDLSTATPVAMTDAGGGLWTATVDFTDGDLFSFVVENNVVVEFSAATAASTDESAADNFPTLLANGTANIAGSVTITGTAGTATLTTDYSYTNEVINIAVGTYDGTTATDFVLVAPTLVNDVEVEGNETITFGITPGSGVVVGDADGSTTTANTNTYTITDDDAYIVSIGSPTDATEGTSNITYTVSLENGTLNTTGAAITGTLALTGTATNGTDYTDVTTFSIPNGLGTATITVIVTDDANIEVTETVIATISAPSVGTIGTAAATANILDDDAGALTISIGSPVDGTEGGANISYTVSIDGGGTNTTGSAITGTVALTGTATNGTDYTDVTTFSIPDGSGSTVVTVSVTDDSEVEVTETVIATISAPSVGTINVAATTANINDNDAGSATISISTPVDGTEGTSDVTYVVGLDGGLSNGTGAAITGTIALTGTATNGTDYTDVTTFSIPDGSASVTITVTVTNDTEVEITETVIATISAPSTGAIGTAAATANILDDDAAALMISINSPTDATEGTSDVTYTVELDGGVSNGTGAVITGSLALTGTATNGTDYTDVTTFAIPDGASSVLVTVPVTDDALVEATETVIATISAPNVGAIGTASQSADILDDDAASLTVSLGNNPADATEGTSDLMFDVVLDGGVSNGSGSDITGVITFGGTAANGIDYTDVATFAIPDGANSATVSVVVIDDSEVEMTESVDVTISGLSIGAVGSGSVAANILDDDANNLTISIDTPTDGSETGPVAITYVVSMDGGLTNSTGSDISGLVNLSGSATAGSDYVDVLTFTIPDGQSDAIITVTVVDDSEIEGSETVIATISSPTLGSIGTTNEATANIADDDLKPGDEVNYVLTPNGDGDNDVLVILGLEDYPNNVLQIYSRWGNLVFEAENYQNDWGGQANSGKAVIGSGELPNGTYYFTLSLGDGKLTKGFIELKKQ